MKLRPMLATIAFVLCFSLVIPNITIANHGYGKSKKPNVIVFMADDLGQISVPLYNPDDSELVQQRRDLGNQFPENPPMPALEELAKQGVTFRNGWAMPVCSTTRGARSTGKYPSTTGLGQVIGLVAGDISGHRGEPASGRIVADPPGFRAMQAAVALDDDRGPPEKRDCRNSLRLRRRHGSLAPA